MPTSATLEFAHRLSHQIDRVKAELVMIIKEGLITEERVSIVFVGGKKKSDVIGEKP